MVATGPMVATRPMVAKYSQRPNRVRRGVRQGSGADLAQVSVFPDLAVRWPWGCGHKGMADPIVEWPLAASLASADQAGRCTDGRAVHSEVGPDRV